MEDRGLADRTWKHVLVFGWGAHRCPGVTGILPPNLHRLSVAWGTHIWCRRGSRVWREASALKYKEAPQFRRALPLPQRPHLWEILILPRHQPLLAPGSGTHHWSLRGAETASGPLPRPGESLGKKESLKPPFRNPPYPSSRTKSPPISGLTQSPAAPTTSPQVLLKREVTTAPAPEAIICWRGLMPPGSWSAIM